MAKTEIRYCPQCYLSRRFVDGVCAVCEYAIPGWGGSARRGFADSMGVTDQVVDSLEKAFPENMTMKRTNTGWLATQFPEAFRNETE